MSAGWFEGLRQNLPHDAAVDVGEAVVHHACLYEHTGHDFGADLAADPDEMKNHAAEAESTDRLARLRAALTAELKRTAAPAALMPKPQP